MLLNIIIALVLLKIIIFLLLPKKPMYETDESTIEKMKNKGVDIIVPMYNEEKIIFETVEALKKVKYHNLTIILVDDGSSDETLNIVRKHYEQEQNFIIISQQNKGKASALNNAIKNSNNEIIICIDADTIIEPDLIEKLLPYFQDPRVAAVSGNIKISNKINLITKIQSTEYMTMYNYDRELFEAVNGILIIPGALGAFRRQVVNSLGGYKSDTLAEDTELTSRILCNNYFIRNASDVVGYTEAPADLKMFLRQRIRWKVGTFQVLSNYPLSHPNKILSYLIIPYNWIFGMILPVITPIIDYLVFYRCLFVHDLSLLKSYLLFIVIDSAICSVIIMIIKESPSQIFFMVFQRFFLRQLAFLTNIAIVFKAITGDLFRWKKITRYGTKDPNLHNIKQTKIS